MLPSLERQSSGTLSQKHQNQVDAAVAALKAAGEKAVVVSGIHDKGAQAMVLAINNALGSVVMDAASPRLIRSENGNEVTPVIEKVIAGDLGGLITVGINPVFTLPEGEAFAEGIKNLICPLLSL